MSTRIEIEHLARVEGHGGITVTLEGNEVARVEFDVFEGIRLFEGLVVGHRAEEVQGIVSRICAICSHAHSIVALEALENAFGVRVSEQTRSLRDLGMQGGNIESHALHVFALALPDFTGHDGLVDLARTAPDAVRLGLRLKKLGNTIQEVVGGRAVHPVNYVLGGFGRLPDDEALDALRRSIARGLEDCRRMIDFLEGVPWPRFVEEPIRSAALVPDGDAFLFGDRIRFSDGAEFPVADYREVTREYAVQHSHAKHSPLGGTPYMVGALPRLTLGGDRVGGLAREAWERLGLTTPSSNVIDNNLAQAVELVRSVERADVLVRDFLRRGLDPAPPVSCQVKAGRGVAAVEAPRGMLFHAYEVGADGRITGADVITPTCQNLLDAERQLRATVRDRGTAGEAELRHRLEMVGRAYDPCISCAVHVVQW